VLLYSLSPLLPVLLFANSALSLSLSLSLHSSHHTPHRHLFTTTAFVLRCHLRHIQQLVAYRSLSPIMSHNNEELGPTGQPISFFQILKSLAGQLSLGTDITRIALPSIFCYPLSLLEIMAIKRLRGMDQLTEYAIVAAAHHPLKLHCTLTDVDVTLPHII
jgi:hypothetical protein